MREFGQLGQQFHDGVMAFEENISLFTLIILNLQERTKGVV